MAKHHPDLIMCRKQPGIGMPSSNIDFLSVRFVSATALKKFRSSQPFDDSAQFIGVILLPAASIG